MDERTLGLFLILAGSTAVLALFTWFPAGWFSVSPDGSELSFTNAKHVWSYERRHFQSPEIQAVVLKKTLNFGVPDSFSIWIRVREGPEQLLWEGRTGLSDRLAATVAKGLSQAGVAVTLLMDDSGYPDKGTTPWEPTAVATGFPLLLPGWLLGLAGFGVRAATARMGVIVLAAFALWLCGMWLHIRLLRQFKAERQDKQLLWVHLSLWNLQFLLFYVIGVLAAGSVLGR